MVVTVAVHAAPIITVTPSGPLPNGASNGGNDLYVFNINPNGAVFDIVDVTFVVEGGGGFVGENIAGVYEFTPAGSDNTDVLGLNTVALGWTVLNDADDPTFFTSAGGPLGLDIVAPVDYAQIVAVPGSFGTWRIRFADNGVALTPQSGVWGIPEPGTFALLGLCLMVIAAKRRS